MSDDNDGNQITDEQRLLYHLFDQYEKAVRPVRNASDTVVVRMGMTMTNIFDMDEKNQLLTTNVWLDQEWKDEWLVWDPKEFGEIESVRVPCDLIWLPDIVLYNNADDYTIDSMNSRVILFYDGTVFWPPLAQLRSTCKTDVAYFPFDSQHCAIKFGSWTYHGLQVDITNRSINVDLSYYMESGEFDLVRVFQKRRAIKYTCCLEPYPDITFYIHIRRKTLYYLYNIVFPCLMMSILTLLVFILPSDSNEKITLGITVLLAFSVFMLAIAEKMPETSDSIPLIGIYLTIVMLLTSISVIMTVMVLNFHHRGPFDRPVPECIRVLVLKKLRHFLKINLRYPIYSRRNISNGQPDEICSRQITGLKLHNQFENQLVWLQETELVNIDKHLRRHKTRRSIDLQLRFHKILQRFLRYHERNELYQMITNEWRHVAHVVDCLLFWIFLICTVVTAAILLLIIPIEYRLSDDFHN
ncbi:unnamed protein product [Cercopithifilaria johnstoni]|uniref:Uncharacterized protein n=1 Tax=Cercopithifilaria johnstoni TaxID=2874296 RepID=A0A8J2M605_9BILA|nr:unnamed protein product [Cercopithifilaria johnstoni]